MTFILVFLSAVGFTILGYVRGLESALDSPDLARAFLRGFYTPYRWIANKFRRKP